MSVMRFSTTRRKSIVVFITLGVCAVALAVALNVTWILLNWQRVALLVLGIILFSIIITSLVLNTIFLVREIRRNEQHDSFINAVTHELKTPITTIRLYLETLKTREVEEAQRREFYDVMLSASDRLQHTVEQVLRAGRAGHKQGRTLTTNIDLGELVGECVEVFRARYNLDAGAMRYTDSSNGNGRTLVRGDAEELRAAVSNLIDNAVKYSVKVVDVSVEVGMLDEKNAVVRVRDKGVGIQTGHMRRIFKRFYRAPGRVMAHVKGTGLGLFIVRSVVRKHGGRVYAESEGAGRGSTFTIELPGVARSRTQER